MLNSNLVHYLCGQICPGRSPVGACLTTPQKPLYIRGNSLLRKRILGKDEPFRMFAAALSNMSAEY